MNTVRAVAWSLGDRLQVRELEAWPPVVGGSPTVLAAPRGGFAVLFRFGGAAAVGVDREGEDELLAKVRPFVEDPRERPFSETVTLRVDPDREDGLDPNGEIHLRALDVGRVQVVGSVLAKSAFLTDYEERVGPVFDRIDTIARRLEAARLPGRGGDLLREIGAVLRIQSRMVGRAEVSEKPEVTWDDPELDRLYERLAVEFELRDRDLALTRKLELISTAASTYLDLLTDRRSLRVEWYIVALILVEIALVVYEMWR